MEYELEVADRFSPREPAEDVLYSGENLRGDVETTRLYRLTTGASRDALEAFVLDVLVDEVSQRWELRPADEDGSLHQDFCHRLDVGLKPGVLDLEREYLLEFLEEAPDPRLTLEGLTILKRHYLFASNGDQRLLETARRDLVNPVVHRWSVDSHAHDG